MTTYATVWDAIEDTPEKAAAMRLRASVMIAVTKKVQSWKVTQREAASRLGITQPRLNELLKGRISAFSLDALMALASRAGFMAEIALRSRKASARAGRKASPGLTPVIQKAVPRVGFDVTSLQVESYPRMAASRGRKRRIATKV